MRSGLIYIIILALVSFSCSEKKQLTRSPASNIQSEAPDYSSSYNPGSTILHPDFLVYHNSAETSQINFRLYFRELRFNMANPERKNMARVKISYVLYPSFENLSVIDSASHIVNVIPAEGSNYFIGALNIPVKKNNEYVLEVSVRDILRGSSGKSYLYIDKRSDFNAQNFKVYSGENMTQLFTPNYFNNKSVNIQFNRMPGNDIKVEEYISPLPFPKAPYIVDSSDYRPLFPDRINDVTFRELQNFQLNQKGLYFFRLNQSDTAGLLLGYFSSDYPRINTLGQMTGPLKYISSDEAYLNIMAQTNKKLAIDNFWLKLSGSTDGARELIRIYYSRALFANFYFTDISEGWRTDRGMIYMIFGNPVKITRLDNEEIWSYKKNLRSKNPSFHFKQIPSKLSNNLFRLERNSEYRNIWDRAISSWRSGKPFSFSE